MTLKGRTVRVATSKEHLWGWVTDAKTEKPIPGLQGATVELMVGKAPVAFLRVIMPEVDVVATVDSVTEVCPHCGAESPESSDKEERLMCSHASGHVYIPCPGESCQWLHGPGAGCHYVTGPELATDERCDLPPRRRDGAQA